MEGEKSNAMYDAIGSKYSYFDHYIKEKAVELKSKDTYGQTRGLLK